MELQTLTVSPNQPLPSCRHVSPKGRHCRQAVPTADSLYCAIHAAKHHSAASSTQLTIDLASQLREVHSSSDITGFLIGVINLLAENRIPARRAAVLTYIANSIRQSLRDEQREAASAESSSSLRIDFGDAFGPSSDADASAASAPPTGSGILARQT